MLTDIFGPLIFIISLNLFAVFRSRKSFGEILPVTIMLAAFLLYVCQFVFFSYKPGIYVLALCGFLGEVEFLYVIFENFLNHQRDDTSKNRERISRIFSSGFWAFLAIYIVILIADYDRKLNAWDELSHWGMMVKEMFRTDHFYTDPSSHLLVHKDYPPFVQLFEYAWCTFAGGYSEMSISMGLHVMTLSFLIPGLMDQRSTGETVCDKVRWYVREILKGTISATILILLMLSFDPDGTGVTIYTDTFMAVISVYAAMLIISDATRNTLFGTFRFILALTALLLTKQMGIAFFMIAVSLEILFYVRDIICKDSKLCMRKTALTTVLSIVIPMITSWSWRLYVKSLGIVGQFNLEDVDLHNFNDLVHGVDTGSRFTAYHDYMAALTQRNIYSGIVPVSYMGWFILALGMLFIIFLGYSNHFRKSTFFIIEASFVYGTIGYAFTMLILYLYCYSEGEMLNLASFGRYMATYAVAEALIMALILLRQINFAEKRNTLRYVILFIISLLVLDRRQISKLAPPTAEDDSMAFYRGFAGFLNERVEPGASVFIIADSNSDYQYYTAYYDNELRIDLNWDYLHLPEADYSNEDFIDGFLREIAKNDYIFVIYMDDEINSVLAPLNGNMDLYGPEVYRVDATDGTVSIHGRT
jgi:hypothetical protein